MGILLAKREGKLVISLPGMPTIAFDATHSGSLVRKDLLSAMGTDALKQLRKAETEDIPKPSPAAQAIAAKIMEEGVLSTISDKCVSPHESELFTSKPRPEGAYEGSLYAARLLLKNGNAPKALKILSEMVDCYIMGLDLSVNDETAREAIPLGLTIARPWIISYGLLFSRLSIEEFVEFKGGIDGILAPRDAIMLLGLVGDLRDQLALSRSGNGACHCNIEQYCSGAMEKIRARTAFRLAHYLMAEETLAHFGMADGTPLERIDNSIAHIMIQFRLMKLLDAFPIFNVFGSSSCGPISGEKRVGEFRDLLRDGLKEPIEFHNSSMEDGPAGWRLGMATTFCVDWGLLESVPEPKPSRLALTNKGRELIAKIFEAIAGARIIGIQPEE